MRTIIALSGFKGSGKTTTFNILKEILPEAKEVTLARRLKAVCSMVFNIPMKHFDDPALKEVPFKKPRVMTESKLEAIVKAFISQEQLDSMTDEMEAAAVRLLMFHVGVELKSPRHMAQFVGTEVLRAMDPDIHCNTAVNGLPESGTFIVTDMRFPSEFEYFKTKFTGKFIPIYVANNPAEEAGAKETHPSEAQIPTVARGCIKLDNNGTIDELKGKVQFLLKGVEDGSITVPVNES